MSIGMAALSSSSSSGKRNFGQKLWTENAVIQWRKVTSLSVFYEASDGVHAVNGNVELHFKVYDLGGTYLKFGVKCNMELCR